MSKYWIANNPNSEVTDAEAQKVEELSATGVSLAELNLIDDMVASVSSIGMIAKAEAGSTSLYAFGISTTGDTISTTFNLKFGIVKD